MTGLRANKEGSQTVWVPSENMNEKKTHIQNERKNHGEGEERKRETATSQWKGTSRMTKHAQGNVHIKFYNFSVSFFPRLLYFAFWCFSLHFVSFILAIAIANLLDDCLPFYFENYSASKEECQKKLRIKFTIFCWFCTSCISKYLAFFFAWLGRSTSPYYVNQIFSVFYFFTNIVWEKYWNGAIKIVVPKTHTSYSLSVHKLKSVEKNRVWCSSVGRFIRICAPRFTGGLYFAAWDTLKVCRSKIQNFFLSWCWSNETIFRGFWCYCLIAILGSKIY